VILQTGGSPFGWISTRSMPSSSAAFMASRVSMMPICSPSAPSTRTLGTRISAFLRLPLLSVVAIPLSSRRLIGAGRERSALRLGLQLFDELGHRHAAEVLSATGTYGNGSGFLLAVTDHDEIGHLLQRMLPDFITDFLVAQIRLNPEALSDKGLGDFTHVIGLCIGDAEHYCLNGGKPGRKQARVVFDQDTDETLHRADDGPVQHDRMLAL